MGWSAFSHGGSKVFAFGEGMAIIGRSMNLCDSRIPRFNAMTPAKQTDPFHLTRK